MNYTSHQVYKIMTNSAVIQCCRRKSHVLRYLFIILAVWILIVLITTLITKNQHWKLYLDKAKPGKLINENIFDKWYLSNRRNLLEDENEFAGNAKFMNIPLHPTNLSKVIAVPQDITQYYAKVNEETIQKVFGILESFRLVKNPNVPDELNCQDILKGDQSAVVRGKLANLELGSKKFEDKKKKLIPRLEDIVVEAKNCGKFKQNRQYITISLSSEEKAYSIAYIITIHRDLPSFERLLRSIYHPQNIYCVHVDAKSDQSFKDGAKVLTDCFDNVFLASKPIDVRYTHWSRLQADLNCMEDLAKRSMEYPWRYVINLCGQDFPIKTNLEIVRALKSLQGLNSLETFVTPPHKKKRYELHFDLPSNPKNDHSVMKKTDIKKSPPPHKFEMFAGSAYYIFKRAAVEFILTDRTVQEFFKWNEDTYSPDEHVWASLQRHFPQFPGSFPPHEKYDLNELQTITRIIKWGGLDKKVYPKCEGRFVRGICVFGCGDLAWLITQKHLFANKFEPDVDILAIHCLENWVRNRTIDHSKIYFARGFL
uniref:beta-1,3-galactosyl-O-glycosyl-glycoprotein beta-1,6-N-acetylglucosaminyltransferase 3-like n=1 Tax=Styela clava TaxID=7725 RepID=UPI001939789D|nr:beta-1,3-galactosyl-O-glycosyl-glycoprotein beta-1,6-N-acetylglucosaminyltransferase 3-like [Styela clava]